MKQDWKIQPVQGLAAIAAIRGLMEEYWNSFGFTPCFQNFGEELAGLPGAYAPPGGGLAQALAEGQPVGCIAFRRVDDKRAEAKRLYVRPAWRGRGIGHALLEWVIAEARSAGYAELTGDTMPVMTGALALYRRMGFEISYAGAAAPAGQPAALLPQLPQEPILLRLRL